MNAINYTIARDNMVNQQLRTWDVFDPRVLDLFATLPREAFVPERFKHLAYADTPLPLDNGLELAPPREQARVLQALAIQATDRVLEVGKGREFMTQCLSKLSQSVETLDFTEALKQKGPYEVICIHGSVKKLPEKFAELLSVGGRLFAIIGDAPAMSATLLTRVNETDKRAQILFETYAPRLEQGEPKPEFEF
jgi:protein-L-isoaspartate(D-aspartate) O-methyltransferase